MRRQPAGGAARGAVAIPGAQLNSEAALDHRRRDRALRTGRGRAMFWCLTRRLHSSVDFAVKAEGATANITAHATRVSAALNDVMQWTDQAVAAAQRVQKSTSAADAAPLIAELVSLTTAITDGIDANRDGQVGWQTTRRPSPGPDAHGLDDGR